MAKAVAPVTVVCPSGILNAESASALEQQLTNAVTAKGAGELVVDMSRVESLDTGGLVYYMSALNACASAPPPLAFVSF